MYLVDLSKLNIQDAHKPVAFFNCCPSCRQCHNQTSTYHGRLSKHHIVRKATCVPLWSLCVRPNTFSPQSVGYFSRLTTRTPTLLSPEHPHRSCNLCICSGSMGILHLRCQTGCFRRRRCGSTRPLARHTRSNGVCRRP